MQRSIVRWSSTAAASAAISSQSNALPLASVVSGGGGDAVATREDFLPVARARWYSATARACSQWSNLAARSQSVRRRAKSASVCARLFEGIDQGHARDMLINRVNNVHIFFWGAKCAIFRIAAVDWCPPRQRLSLDLGDLCVVPTGLMHHRPPRCVVRRSKQKLFQRTACCVCFLFRLQKKRCPIHATQIIRKKNKKLSVLFARDHGDGPFCNTRQNLIQ
ncbi:hypothetical protein TW95_gp0895 [Pandoravirus inopinatum]|uniref:Uncharacterized protein n=1 Tax=Pandoravirus inopinatum TaxID=1605721 RepID=A0A0B5J254_9VIRU|nr:hypothetical protein TW95_gp0895 [Pandoravirus inopinatum]AJF97629.1 hypothetical protein [Pandoravirus inopinatum]